MGEVSSAVEAIKSQLAVLHEACDGLSHRELVRLLSELTTVVWSVPALEHRAMNRLVGETEPHALGEASWKKVLTTALRVSSADAGRRLREARNLGPRRAMTGEPLAPVWEATAAAQARGAIGAEHVEIIGKFHKRLPSWVDVSTREVADTQLAGLAAGLGPEALDEAAGTLLAMIDQDGPEPCEKDQARKRAFRIGKQQSDGMSKVSGELTPEARAVLDAVFAKLAAPGMCNPEDENPCVDGEPDAEQRGCDTRTQGQRNHDALIAMGLIALSSGQLGKHNGLPVTVIASTTLQELESAAGVAVTGGGSLLPMRDLIRMASHAYHYLAVFDQHTNEALYLGRTKRLASPAQRIVLHARDRGCTRPGCTVPGYWCQVHHAVEDWKDGGQTNVNDMSLACGPDNRMIDKTDWTTTRANGNTEWHPPPDLDTGQKRTNDYHHPERYLLPEDDNGP
jgi:hypothetical protein